MIARYVFPRRGAAGSAWWDAKYRSESARAQEQEAYARQGFVQVLLSHLAPGQRVLDVGCGTGGLLHFLQERGFLVAGIDSSVEAVAVAQQRVPQADIALADLTHVPFPEASFDAYLAIGSWEYIQDGPSAPTAEARRVLKPGGIAIIEVPYANPLRRLCYLPLKKLESILRTLAGEKPRFAHYFFRIDDLRRVLQNGDLQVLSVHPHDLPEPTLHYGLWVDWPFLRGGPHYRLNRPGRIVKRLGNALSPWTIATGIVIVARKK